MAEIHKLIAHNRERHAPTFDKGHLGLEPGRKLAVICGMDARIHPYKVLGLQEGEAHIIRNAGGRVTDDVVRSLLLSQYFLGTREVVVMHHTDSMLTRFGSNEDIRRRLRDEFGVDASGIDFLPVTDIRQSLLDDIARLRASPLLMKDVPIHGLIYDVRTGSVEQVQ